MNYLKIYNDLINKAQSENRVKGEGVYYESHHIVPRCLGGSDDVDNLVNLTAKEHFIAHKLLCEIYPGESKLKSALYLFMTKFNETNHGGVLKYKVGCREYDRLRKEYSKITSDFFKNIERNKDWCYKISLSKKGTNNPFFGKTHTEEWRENHSTTISGENHPMYGKKHTKSAKQKMSIAKKGRKPSNAGVYLDLENGIFNDIYEVMEHYPQWSKQHINAMVAGKRPNKTRFIKV